MSQWGWDGARGGVGVAGGKLRSVKATTTTNQKQDSHAFPLGGNDNDYDAVAAIFQCSL